MQEKPNTVRQKSYAFAVKIVKYCRFLTKKKEFVVCTQLLKSGTSVGANIEEAVNAPSKKDFANKLSIALKEAYESRYWLMLIRDADVDRSDQITSLLSDIEELIALLTAILKTTRQGLSS